MTGSTALRSVTAADVYKGDRLAGTLVRTGDDVTFSYGSDYLDDPTASAIAWSLPKSLQSTVASGGSVPAFFAGLLPEGVRLSGVVSATKTSEDDHLTLLLAVGADTIGDVRVVPSGDSLPEQQYAFDPRSPVADLRALFESLSSADSLDIDHAALPGVQGKVSAQMYSSPVQTTTGPAILKLAPPQRFPHLIENENFFMTLAGQCGIRVPRRQIVTDRHGTTALLVERFDRHADRRLAQEDACQVLGIYPASKYRAKTETVISALADAVERGGGSAQQGRSELMRMTVFSYAIGNGDLHGKNYSIYRNSRDIWTVTPAYDLLCTQPYAQWKDPMALDLYGRANRWSRAHIVESSGRMGLPERAALKIIDDVCAGVRSGVSDLDSVGFDPKSTARLADLLSKRCDELSDE